MNRIVVLMFVLFPFLTQAKLLWNQNSESQINLGLKESPEKTYRFSPYFDLWFSGLDGEVKVVREEDEEDVGETLDLIEDLGLKDISIGWGLGLRVAISRRNCIFIWYQQSRYSGEVDIEDDTYEFAGEDFSGEINTMLLVDSYGFHYQFLALSNDKGYLGPIVGVENYLMSLVIESREDDIKATPTVLIPVPVLGIGGAVNLGKGFSFNGDGTFMVMSGGKSASWLPIPLFLALSGAGKVEDFYAFHYRVNLGVEYQYSWFKVGLGYLAHGGISEWVFDDKEDRVEIGEQGFLLEIGARF